jgi:hypothetical protein
MSEGVTEVQVEAIAQDWLKAIRQLPGGAAVKMRVFFPAVASGAGNVDFYFVLNAPSFTDWGKIWDAYQDDSAAAKSDDLNQGKVTCADSQLWEAHAKSWQMGSGSVRRGVRPAGPSSSGRQRMGPLEGVIAGKALHAKRQGVDRELLARVEALGAALRPTPVVRLAHPRLHLFAKLEYQSVVGSLKDRPAYYMLRDAIRRGASGRTRRSSSLLRAIPPLRSPCSAASSD